MKSNLEYRKSAIASLRGHWKQAALLSLIVLVISLLTMVIKIGAFDSTDTKIITGIDSLYSVFVVLPASFAMIVVYLRLVRDPETDVIRSFTANCTDNYGRALCSMLLLTVISACFAIVGVLFSAGIASIPFTFLDIPFELTGYSNIHSKYAFLKLLKSPNTIIFIFLVVCIFCLSLIPLFMYTYKICLFPYIIEDHPNIGIRESYVHSKEMMENRRMKLFLLDLSFIGWYILSIFTLFIGLLWVIPYHQTARAHFYNDLKSKYTKL